jgi:protoporphyrinogen oxidase
MKIAIIGAGFTGLSAALKLSKNKNCEISVYENNAFPGGLAGSFKLNSWQSSIEKHYHHWFSNDKLVLDLISDLGLSDKLIFPKTLTSIYINNNNYPFNGPMDLLSFSPMSFIQRIRTGLILLYLKLLPSYYSLNLEKYTSFQWLENSFGKKIFNILWKPLFIGKFGKYASEVNMTWFWARIKKRTIRLGYLKGGYQILIDKMLQELKLNNVKILLSTPYDKKLHNTFDKIIFTTPTSIFLKYFPNLPEKYKNRLNSIPHLFAHSLLVISDEKILEKEYWLNINEPEFPFIGIIQHTNLINKSYFGGKHIAYIANYLPDNHPYLNLTTNQLLNTYLPYLKKINPEFNFQSSKTKYQLFSEPYAQPVFTKNYSFIKPDFITPIPNTYLANMDMVYPWDRGTNYAIELGYKVADIIQNQESCIIKI